MSETSKRVLKYEASLDCYTGFRDDARTLAREVEAAETRIAELEEALRPFVKANSVVHLSETGWASLASCRLDVTGDVLRAARAALAKGGK